MLEITPHSGRSVPVAVPVHHTAAAARQRPAAAEPSAGDRVELSAAARDFEPRSQAVRATEERIQDLRERIAAGTYLTDDKIDYVVDRLHEELLGALPHVA